MNTKKSARDDARDNVTTASGLQSLRHINNVMAAAKKMWKLVSRVFNDRLHPYNDCELQRPERIAYRFKILEQNKCTRFVQEREIHSRFVTSRFLLCVCSLPAALKISSKALCLLISLCNKRKIYEKRSTQHKTFISLQIPTT